MGRVQDITGGVQDAHMKAAFDWEDNTGSKVAVNSCAEWVRASVCSSDYSGRVAAIMTSDVNNLCYMVFADDGLCKVYNRLYGDNFYVEGLDLAKQRVDTVLLEAGYKTLPAHMRTLT